MNSVWLEDTCGFKILNMLLHGHKPLADKCIIFFMRWLAQNWFYICIWCCMIWGLRSRGREWEWWDGAERREGRYCWVVVAGIIMVVWQGWVRSNNISGCLMAMKFEEVFGIFKCTPKKACSEWDLGYACWAGQEIENLYLDSMCIYLLSSSPKNGVVRTC